jgi:hypothetical protein
MLKKIVIIDMFFFLLIVEIIIDMLICKLKGKKRERVKISNAFCFYSFQSFIQTCHFSFTLVFSFPFLKIIEILKIVVLKLKGILNDRVYGGFVNMVC